MRIDELKITHQSVTDFFDEINTECFNRESETFF